MAKIIAIAENFAFGPISKLVTVTRKLREHGHEIIFIGDGTAYELGSKENIMKYINVTLIAEIFRLGCSDF